VLEFHCLLPPEGALQSPVPRGTVSAYFIQMTPDSQDMPPNMADCLLESFHPFSTSIWTALVQPSKVAACNVSEI